MTLHDGTLFAKMCFSIMAQELEQGRVLLVYGAAES